MLLVDIVLVLVLLGFVLAGSHHGFVKGLGRLLGAVIGFLVARLAAPYLGMLVALFLPGRSEGIANFIAFVILFLLVERLVGFLFGLIGFFFNLVARLPILSHVNSLLGALLGFVEGVIVIGTAIHIVNLFNVHPTVVSWLAQSSVAKYFQYAFSVLLGYLV
jgi:uncharacterized membrane protein required for colicin V production